MLSIIAKILKRTLPSVYFFIHYKRGLRRLMDTEFASSLDENEHYFQYLISEVGDKPGLQVSIKNNIGRIGPNWKVIDKYDPDPRVDYAYDLLDMPFEDESFSGIYCQSVLEHVENPQRAINEMERVLAPGGLIFVQLPFTLNYHPDPYDYWRASPLGLRMWMENFDEIRCGALSWSGSALTVSVYFIGKKP